MSQKIPIIIAGVAIAGITIGGLAYAQLNQSAKPTTKVSVNFSSESATSNISQARVESLSSEIQSSDLSSKNALPTSSKSSTKLSVIDISFDCHLVGKFESGKCVILDQNKNVLRNFESTGQPILVEKTNAHVVFYTDKRAYGLCSYTKYKFEFELKLLSEIDKKIGCENEFFQNNPQNL